MLNDMLNEFAKVSYTFLQIEDGLVVGEYQAMGVFKERTGIANDGRHDSHNVASSLHIYSSELFIARVGGYIGLEGHEVLIGSTTYRIDGVSNGTALAGNGYSEFYRLTLTKKDSRWASDLPVS